jgi:hypothetical protein
MHDSSNQQAVNGSAANPEWTAGTVFDNYVKGCYSIIISGVALAAIRRLGNSNNSINLICRLWAKLEHHVYTGYGVSDKTCTSTIDKLLYSIGQGICASLIIWALLNQLLIVLLGENLDCI